MPQGQLVNCVQLADVLGVAMRLDGNNARQRSRNEGRRNSPRLRAEQHDAGEGGHPRISPVAKVADLLMGDRYRRSNGN